MKLSDSTPTVTPAPVRPSAARATSARIARSPRLAHVRSHAVAALEDFDKHDTDRESADVSPERHAAAALLGDDAGQPADEDNDERE